PPARSDRRRVTGRALFEGDRVRPILAGSPSREESFDATLRLVEDATEKEEGGLRVDRGEIVHPLRSSVDTLGISRLDRLMTRRAEPLPRGSGDVGEDQLDERHLLGRKREGESLRETRKTVLASTRARTLLLPGGPDLGARAVEAMLRREGEPLILAILRRDAGDLGEEGPGELAVLEGLRENGELAKSASDADVLHGLGARDAEAGLGVVGGRREAEGEVAAGLVELEEKAGEAERGVASGEEAFDEEAIVLLGA